MAFVTYLLTTPVSETAPREGSTRSRPFGPGRPASSRAPGAPARRAAAARARAVMAAAARQPASHARQAARRPGWGKSQGWSGVGYLRVSLEPRASSRRPARWARGRPPPPPSAARGARRERRHSRPPSGDRAEPGVITSQPLGRHGARHVRYAQRLVSTRTRCFQCVRPWVQAALRLRYVSNAEG